MNSKLAQCLFLGIILILNNLFVILGHPVENENDSTDGQTSEEFDKVTQNYVEQLVKSEKHLLSLRQFAVEWAHNNALIFRNKKVLASTDAIYRSDVAVIAPFSLFPSPFPRHVFEDALAVQKALNLLYFRVATDIDFLERAYSDLIKTDENFRNTMDVLRTVREEGIRQPITVMYQRADYMLNFVGGQDEAEPNYEIKQLEVNCGSVAGTSLDRRTAQLNHVMLQRAGFHPAPEDLPENWPDKAQIESIKMAWEAYNKSEAIVVILINSVSETIFDAHFFETELDRLSNGRIKVERITLNDCVHRCKLDENFALRLDGREVAVVKSRYSVLGLRASGTELKLLKNFRLMIERSLAIKIPSAFIGFSCSKKVQQLLAQPGELEHFFPEESDAEMVKAIRKTFAGMWSLENTDENTEQKIKDAINHPENYVLKSNMECGGNNYFDEEIPKKLTGITPTERSFHILMQKLRPMSIKNVMVHPNTKPKINDMVSELAVYGVLIGNMTTRTVSHNVQQGHLLKTKLATANEGGISTGSAVHDSPILF
ncbi:hypothetical protein niasHT_011151 [Heterodera trifolii]|uniref:Glutathione synthetase n=1 Tax=Heterodera trifolii TaxID=157864 RepID=A0ABD2L3Y0_9BILA